MGKKNLFDIKKAKIRFKYGDFILYEPSNIDKKEIKEVLKENSDIKETGVVSEITINTIKAIFNNLVENGDFINELSDEEIRNKISSYETDDSDRGLVLLFREIKILLDELIEDILYEYSSNLRQIRLMLKKNNINDEGNETVKLVNKFLKKNKINKSFEEIVKEMEQGKTFQQIIETQNKNNKKVNK